MSYYYDQSSYVPLNPVDLEIMPHILDNRIQTFLREVAAFLTLTFMSPTLIFFPSPNLSVLPQFSFIPLYSCKEFLVNYGGAFGHNMKHIALQRPNEERAIPEKRYA
jgi:hypothetical protein